MNERLKALAVACPIFGDAATVWMLPFRNVETSVREKQLDALDPHYLYTNTETGATTHVMPPDYALALDQKLDTPWTVTDLWSATHSNFTAVEPLIVDIEFAPWTDQTPIDVRALAHYWQNAPKDTTARWDWWLELISIDVSNALVDAYKVARASLLRASSTMNNPGEDALPQSGSATSRKKSGS